MLTNILKTALRNLWKNRASSIINVIGLSIGISCCVIAFLFVKSSLSFEGFHEKADRIYRITYSRNYATGINYSAHTPYPLATAIRTDFADLEAVAQIHEESEALVSVGEERFEEDHVLFADSGFFEVFSYDMLIGEGSKALTLPNSVILTESAARRFFGEESPMGKRIRFANRFDLQVNGLMADPPENSHLRFSFLVSWPMLEAYNLIGNDLKEWGWVWSGATYVLLPETMLLENVVARFPAMEEKYLDAEDAASTTYALQALHDIHFDERFAHDSFFGTISRSKLWGIALIAALVLITACINFTNLATAQATRRSREVGIRKVLGSSRAQLIRQFLGEAFLTTLFSIAISLLLAELVLPMISQLLEYKLMLSLTDDPMLWGFLLLVLVGVSLLAGFYPAVVISGYEPVWALKNHLHSYQSGGLNLRKSLVVVQFVISQVLIFGTIVITAQLKYFEEKNLGFDQEAIILFALPSTSDVKPETLGNELRKSPAILEASFSSGPPTSSSKLSTTFISKETDNPETYRVELKLVDSHYAETFGLELLAGRWLGEVMMDSIQGYVVNEALIRKIGITDAHEALGKRISPSINDGTVAPIVGVVRDFHNESLHGEIQPCILLNSDFFRYSGAIKVRGGAYDSAIASLGSTWTATFPAYLFDYQFLDEQLAENYEEETRFQRAFQLFALIAILIGCLGLYGLVAYMALQRSKEIGIRKVMGATVKDIVLLLSREFSLLVLVAFAIAAPLAAWAMHLWLQEFAYRITMGPGVFVLTLLVAISIAWLTVGYKAWTSARKNPVEAIRTE